MPFLDTLKTGALLVTSIALLPPQLLAAAQISLPTQSLTLGGNAVLPVTFQSGSGPVSGVQFDLQYDNTVMTLTATVGDAANNAGKTLYSADLTPNTKRFLITGMNLNAISTGTIVNLSVTLNANGLLGTSPLTFSNVAGTDPNGLSSSVTSSNGAVIIIGSSQYVLTTSVSPAGSGSIAANPTSAGGSYNLGTPVQLTATPAAGCTFSGWTGALTGTLNPQTVIMSGAQAVTANFHCGGSSSGGFVTGYALNNPGLRNNFSGWVGMKLTVGGSPLSVSSLGRICAAGNAMTHLVKLVNVSDGSDVAGASVTVNMAGCAAGQFVYGAVSSINLPAGANYYLVSQEVNGGDQWYDSGTVSTTNAAAVSSSVYFFNGSWIPYGSPNTSFVPVNFQYGGGGGGSVSQYPLSTSVSPAGSGGIAANPFSAGGNYNSGTSVQLTAAPAVGCTFINWTGALSGSSNPQTITMSAAQAVTANFLCNGVSSTSLITGYALNSPRLRNDYGGWVGLELTVGATPLTVSSLGRICAANNASAHTVKLVTVNTGVDVPNAWVSVNMAGCTPGQFVYGAINPIALSAGTSYYLASQETLGGDLWYDLGTVSATSAAVVNSAVYTFNGTWFPYGPLNNTFVPVSFLYTFGAQYLLSTNVSPAGSGGVATNPFSASGLYTAGTPVQLTAIPASGCVFTSWTGTVTGSANPQTITMSGAQTTTANFQCSGPGPASFLTGYALNGPPLRNNFTGWAGLKLTVGASPMTVASLGRVCVANNSMVHAVKLVTASTGVDVPNASVLVNMAGCTAGQFVYGAVNSITLSAGTSYYVVSQENIGGDQWYDFGTVSTTTGATVNSSAYFFNGVWNSYGPANTSFVPANFLYQ